MQSVSLPHLSFLYYFFSPESHETTDVMHTMDPLTTVNIFSLPVTSFVHCLALQYTALLAGSWLIHLSFSIFFSADFSSLLLLFHPWLFRFLFSLFDIPLIPILEQSLWRSSELACGPALIAVSKSRFSLWHFVFLYFYFNPITSSCCLLNRDDLMSAFSPPSEMIKGKAAFIFLSAGVVSALEHNVWRHAGAFWSYLTWQTNLTMRATVTTLFRRQVRQPLWGPFANRHVTPPPSHQFLSTYKNLNLGNNAKGPCYIADQSNLGKSMDKPHLSSTFHGYFVLYHACTINVSLPLHQINY